MTRSATFVIAIWTVNVVLEAMRLWSEPGPVWWLGIAIAFLVASIALGIHESRKSGRSA